jgi:hypothetical protein
MCIAGRRATSPNNDRDDRDLHFYKESEYDVGVVNGCAVGRKNLVKIDLAVKGVSSPLAFAQLNQEVYYRQLRKVSNKKGRSVWIRTEVLRTLILDASPVPLHPHEGDWLRGLPEGRRGAVSRDSGECRGKLGSSRQ